MTQKEIIEQLSKKKTQDGRTTTITKNVSINNVNFVSKETEDENGMRIQMALTTDTEFDTFIANEKTGEYESGKSKVIFPSFYGLQSSLRDIPAAKPFVDIIMCDKEQFLLALCDAKLTILNYPVEEKEKYTNPWSTKTNSLPYIVKHNNWYAHIIKVELGPMGLDYIRELRADAIRRAKENRKS